MVSFTCWGVEGLFISFIPNTKLIKIRSVNASYRVRVALEGLKYHHLRSLIHGPITCYIFFP
jgi:hypothetical protein